MGKDLMVLVPLKKTLLTFSFARVCLQFTEAFDVWMTTLASSINFPVDGSGFLLVFCWGLPC